MQDDQENVQPAQPLDTLHEEKKGVARGLRYAPTAWDFCGLISVPV